MLLFETLRREPCALPPAFICMFARQWVHTPAPAPAGNIRPARDLTRDAHTVVMLVNHRLYNDIPRADIEGKAIIDTRGVWS